MKAALVPLVYRALLKPKVPHPLAFTAPLSAIEWKQPIPDVHKRWLVNETYDGRAAVVDELAMGALRSRM